MWLRILALAFGIWLGGFAAFTHDLGRLKTSSQRTDAIIALTGGKGRVEQAVAQLARGKAKRLLISGVHRNTTARDLQLRTRASKKLFACCVDIGHAATDTVGNAVESAAWMDRNGYKSFRLVTSRSHMPRAMLEFQYGLPNDKMVIHPVNVDNSLADRIGEYNKYAARLIWLRATHL
jgi:uncharacterized SAM-binding protein YcdF (DUF218 family)